MLRTGWVIGCLIVLNSSGTPVETIQGSLINGPLGYDVARWRSSGGAVCDQRPERDGHGRRQRGKSGDLAVSEKAMPLLESLIVVGAGFSERTDPAALVIGPTSVGLDPACEQGHGE